jgi:hypothetical protein
MPSPLSGPGIGLPLAQYLYPSELYNAPNDVSTNTIVLAAGDELPVPAGTWYVGLGLYNILEFQDPLTQSWRAHPASYGPRNQIQYLKSDGFNFRIANRTGCPISAVVTNAGSGYAQATTSVTVSAGQSAWQAIVGGMLSQVTIPTAGSGYAVPPILFIPAPAAPGVAGSGYTAITGGSVTSVTLNNWGAGYASAPPIQILPNPTDPNYLAGSTIVQAVTTIGLFGSGSISAVICTNPGNPQSAAPTLTIGGAGSNATATATLLQTLTGISVRSAGTGIQNTCGLISVGGQPSGNVNTQPEIELTGFLPRPCQATVVVSGGSLNSIGTIYDGGLYAIGNNPTLLLIGGSGSIFSTGASITGIFGSSASGAILQPAP